MSLVRLASRAVIGVFDRASDLQPILPDLAKLNVPSVSVSVIGQPEAFEATASSSRGRGPVGAIGKSADWLSDAQSIDKEPAGKLVGAGPLAEALARSPSTSPVGAMVMQGIPQRDALIYADQLAARKILLLVGVADRTMGERVHAMLVRHAVGACVYYAGRPYGTAFHGTGPGLR